MTRDEIVRSFDCRQADWLARNPEHLANGFKSEELIIDGDRVAQHFIASVTHVGDFMGLAGTNRHGRLEGVLNVSKNLELKPYAVATSTTDRAAAVPFSNDLLGNGASTSSTA